MTSTCAVPPVAGPGQRVVPGAVSGCFDLLDDGYCTNVWDGCMCNGAEACIGSAGDVNSGCGSATARDHWPCDAAASGDGDGCTEEACCEPWNPDGCRVHAAAAAAVADDEQSQLELFCDAVVEGGESVTVATPLGSVECVVGDHQYGVPGVDPVVGDPVPVNKPNGYWCEDCRPCTVDACVSPFGACTNTNLPDGTSVPPPPPPFELPPFVTLPSFSFCSTPQSCTGPTNFGCGFDACFLGQCAAGPNPFTQPPVPGCHGFPVVEFDDDQMIPAFPDAAAETCYELECRNMGLGGVPNWTCVADLHHDLCEDDVFCDGPPTCSYDEFCTGCTSEDVGTILASIATRFEDDPPAGGDLVFGCMPGAPGVACDDDVTCTIDSCVEEAEACESVPDDRNCSVAAGADWEACDPAAVCLEDEGCSAPTGDPPCGGTDQCPLDCVPLENGRMCVGDAEVCTSPTCLTETYRTVPLSSIADLCPFHPDGQIPRGDREFDGHGPVVSVDVALEISADRHSVLANVHFEARETMADFSTIRWDSPPITVFSTAGEILAIVSSTTGRAVGTSADGGTVGIACGGCGIVDFTTYDGIVTHAEARGDTPNDDISHDDNCNTEDTLLQLVELADAEIYVREDCLF